MASVPSIPRDSAAVPTNLRVGVEHGRFGTGDVGVEAGGVEVGIVVCVGRLPSAISLFSISSWGVGDGREYVPSISWIRPRYTRGWSGEEVVVESGGFGNGQVVKKPSRVERGRAVRGGGPRNCEPHQSLLSCTLRGGSAAGTSSQSLASLPPPACAQFLDQATSSVPVVDSGMTPIGASHVDVTAVGADQGAVEKHVVVHSDLRLRSDCFASSYLRTLSVASRIRWRVVGSGECRDACSSSHRTVSRPGCIYRLGGVECRGLIGVSDINFTAVSVDKGAEESEVVVGDGGVGVSIAVPDVRPAGVSGGTATGMQRVFSAEDDVMFSYRGGG